MRIYISGKITGEPPDTVNSRFGEAQAMLEALGHEVTNPLHNGLPSTASYVEHMYVDLFLLLGCDAIYMLQGYERSNGAMVELQVARAVGIAILYEKQNSHTGIVEAINKATGIKPSELLGQCRKVNFVYARMLCAKLMTEQGESISTICTFLSKQHASISHYLQQYNIEIAHNRRFREMDKNVRNLINDNN